MESNLPTRHVFIVGTSMFEEGLTLLLTFGTGLQVSGAKYVDDLWLLDTIVHNQPDVILWSESTLLDSVHMLGLLISTPSLAGLRVIIVRLTDNIVNVYKLPMQMGAGRLYKQQQFVITKRDDLVDVVRG